MPIEAELFHEKRQAPKHKKRGHNQESILQYLQDNDTEAFTQSEIQQETGIKYGPSVNNALHSLKKRGRVSCKSINGLLYWRVVHEVS